MAEELPEVKLKDDFYRDNFGRVMLIIASILFCMGLLVALSLYLYLEKPPPVTFLVEKEWRVQKDVPMDQPYLSNPDVLQWVSNTLQKVFVYDFLNYNDQLKSYTPYFTKAGYQVFLNQLNNYANYNNVQTYKLFVNGVAAGAPFILNQGLLSGRYSWWVQMPITLKFVSYNRSNTLSLTLQILVVRVPTMNNLNGVGIDNVIVAKNSSDQGVGNGST